MSVSFFFALSGYTLANVYLREGQVDWRRFYQARFARIYPLFFVTLLLDTPNLLFFRMARYGLLEAVSKTALTFAGTALMLQGWFPQLQGIDNPNWSLAVETLFFLFPVIGILMWRWSLPLAWVALVAIYLIGQLAVWSSCETSVNLEVIKINPLFHVHEFCCGIFIARIQVGFPRSVQLAIFRFAPPIAGAVGIVFVVVTGLRDSTVYPFLHNGLLLPLYAILIWVLAGGNTWLTSVFSHAFLVLMGEASYALYLLHIPVFHLYEWLLPVSSRGSLSYLVYLSVTLATSVLAFRWVEVPARTALIRRRSCYQPITGALPVKP